MVAFLHTGNREDLLLRKAVIADNMDLLYAEIPVEKEQHRADKDHQKYDDQEPAFDGDPADKLTESGARHNRRFSFIRLFFLFGGPFLT